MSQSHGLSSRGAALFPGATCSVQSSGYFPVTGRWWSANSSAGCCRAALAAAEVTFPKQLKVCGKVLDGSVRAEQDGAVTGVNVFAPRRAKRTVLAGHEG